jgi:hypothetical protein
VVLSWLVAAQCFHAPYVETDVPYGGRMVPWLCFGASTAVFALDVSIGMLTIITFGLH